MIFTEEDIPLMKLIFNPSTHDMGMLIGGERAKHIFEHTFFNIGYDVSYFKINPKRSYAMILSEKNICNFFWDNQIINSCLLCNNMLYHILKYSPIAEKIWDSGKLDLTKLYGDDIYLILRFSPIAEKIWDSGKLDVSLLRKTELEKFKQKFESK